MSTEECKKYITVQLSALNESDNRFLRQLCTIIKRYIKEKGGH